MVTLNINIFPIVKSSFFHQDTDITSHTQLNVSWINWSVHKDEVKIIHFNPI